MPVVAQPAERVRFDCFEANLATGELRKHGVRVKLHDQPFQILAMLVAHPGEMITREEIQQKLWPAGTFVDFENGLNRAVNRLRDALGDSAGEPRFIETIPRHGYRLLVFVERLNGQARAVTEPTVAPSIRLATHRRWIAAAVAAAFVVAAVAGWRLHAAPKKALSFGPRDWLLITNFENRTGNPVFDGTLEYALARELSNSQYVTVVSPERITDALRLMRKPADSRIDAALGREICLRDGDIRALLTGRVEKLGTTYVLTAQLVDPVRDVAVASMSEEDPADSQMAAAVRRLSNRVRESLGEKRALIQQSDEKLEKVTTPSLHALQLYSKADGLMRARYRSEAQALAGQATAAELLREALADDPNFASAHVLLAWTYANRSMDPNAIAEFHRALELATATPDRERLFIRGSYHDFVAKDVPKAIEDYEALVRQYPDHFWAANNLISDYAQVGRWDDSWRLGAHLADMRPDGIDNNEIAACGTFVTKDLNAAMPYIQRVRTLAVAEQSGVHLVDMLPVIDTWSHGDVTKARSQYMQLEKSDKNFSYPSFLWALGEISEADRRAKDDPDIEERDTYLGLSAYLKGDLPGARRRFQNFKGDVSVGGTRAVVMVRSGFSKRVEAVIRKGPPSPLKDALQGELFVTRGKTAQGIALLEKGLEGAQANTYRLGAYYLESETLAHAYEKQGNFDAALRVLRRASEAKAVDSPCQGLMTGAWWLRNELQLADLYRKMGRVPEAEQVENELRKMLIYADADHPIVLALKKRESLAPGVTQAR